MRNGIVLLFIITLFSLGCSGGQDISSPDVENARETSMGTSHYLWGLWMGVIDPEAKTVEFTQLRSGDFHINVIPFLEPPALVNLTLESLEFNGNIIEADIGLRHPFLGLTEFTGFDVCGVFITNGSVSGFTDSGIVMAGPGDTRLLNADGHSRWWNPAEFPVNEGTMFSYNDGLLGAPDSLADYTSTLNGYKYFCDSLEPDDTASDADLVDRGMFSAGQKNIRHYTMEMGNDGLVFNYAIDANWTFPQGDPPYTAPDDFAPGANRTEAWCVEVTEDENTLWNDGNDSGGGLSLTIDIYDWFDIEMNSLRVESPGNFTMIETASPSGGGEGYSTYEVEIDSVTPTEDAMNVVISVISEEEDFGGFITGTNTTAYYVHTASVSSEPNQGLICDLEVVTPMPHDGWGLIEFDASDSEPASPGGVLTFEWDFDGDSIYSEDPDDNYSGDSDHPFHKYEDDYVGQVWVKVSEEGGGELECSVAVDVTAHQSKNITLRSGVRAYDIGIDPENGDLWVGYSDRRIYKHTLAGYYDDGQYMYTVSSNFDRCDTAAGGSTFFIISSATQVNGSAWIYHSDGTHGMAGGWGGGDNWLTDVANFGADDTYDNGNDLMLFVGYFHTTYSVYIVMSRGYKEPYSGTCTYTETWNNTYTGPTKVHHEYVKGMDTGYEGNNLWYLEAPDYYCSAFRLIGSSLYKNFVYNNLYFGTGSESTGDDCWTADACDLAHDPDGTFHVLDEVSGEAVVKVFTPSYNGGESHGHYGDVDSISGTPQRIDGSDLDGTVIVLHGDNTDGYMISVFLDDEQVD